MGHREWGAQVIPALPAVDPSVMPPAVRDGSDEDKQAFRAALAFERVLIGELLKQVDILGESEGEGESESEGAPAAYREMVPDTFADALVAGGGLGLAGTLYESIREQESA